jgi:hypothetical protein
MPASSSASRNSSPRVAIQCVEVAPHLVAVLKTRWKHESITGNGISAAPSPPYPTRSTAAREFFTSLSDLEPFQILPALPRRYSKAGNHLLEDHPHAVLPLSRRSHSRHPGSDIIKHLQNRVHLGQRSAAHSRPDTFASSRTTSPIRHSVRKDHNRLQPPLRKQPFSF